MTILLSNDDGYQAEGLCILADVLERQGHEVYIAAPYTEQSGKSHSMTIAGEIRIREFGHNRYSVEGTPADCMIFTHRSSLFPRKPDLMISGINHGYNLSGDIIYSGTCAAARQAAMYGIPAIALSASEKDSSVFQKAAEFTEENLGRFIDAILPETFMNINFPSSFSGEAELADIGYTAYYDEVEVVEDHGSLKHLSITGFDMERRPFGRELPADFEVCRRGNASVSIVECFPSVSSSASFTL